MQTAEINHKSAIAKARREARKREQQREANRETAKLYAARSAALIMSHHLTGDFPVDWCFRLDTSSLAVSIAELDDAPAVSVSTEHGRGIISTRTTPLVGVVENRSGYVVAVVLRVGGEVLACAVGVCGGELQMWSLHPSVCDTLLSLPRE